MQVRGPGHQRGAGPWRAGGWRSREVSIGDTRSLDWLDQNVGGQVILFSGIFGAGFFCWLVPPHRLQMALGTTSRWWIRRIYLVGRWLPVAVLVWIGITILL